MTYEGLVRRYRIRFEEIGSGKKIRSFVYRDNVKYSQIARRHDIHKLVVGLLEQLNRQRCLFILK